MTKQQLKDDLLKTNGRSAFVTEEEVVRWLGRPKKYTKANVLQGLERADIEDHESYYIDDVITVVYGKVSGNRKFKGKGDNVNKGALIADLKETFGCSFVSQSDVARWMGRSPSYVCESILAGVPSYSESKRKLFFVGDVASRLIEMKRVW